MQLPQLLREKQKWFEETGGLHAAGIFRLSSNGGENAIETLAVFEDIGRHNATDKAIGFGLQNQWLPPRSEPGVLVLSVSGRASSKSRAKLVARIPIVSCGVGGFEFGRRAFARQQPNADWFYARRKSDDLLRV